MNIEEKVWEQVRLCYDPEIPVNVVDLGLIYRVATVPSTAKVDHYDVLVTMTLTSPGCSMGDMIISEIRHRILALENIANVEIEVVFDPPWDRSMISTEAKLILGII